MPIKYSLSLIFSHLPSSTYLPAIVLIKSLPTKYFDNHPLYVSAGRVTSLIRRKGVKVPSYNLLLLKLRRAIDTNHRSIISAQHPPTHLPPRGRTIKFNAHIRKHSCEDSALRKFHMSKQTALKSHPFDKIFNPSLRFNPKIFKWRKGKW